jgi:hypothetical protein
MKGNQSWRKIQLIANSPIVKPEGKKSRNGVQPYTTNELVASFATPPDVTSPQAKFGRPSATKRATFEA